MINRYYFTDRALQVGFKNTLDSHRLNQDKSELTIKPNYLELGIETRYFIGLLKEMVTIYARSIN